MNHEGYGRRMSVVRGILHRFGLEGNEITPVEYFDNCPFPFNNFIYKVALSSPATAESFMGAAQPCTVLLPPEGVSAVIVRLSNLWAEGMNNTNRVENEVAAMHLARGAVAQKLGHRYAGLVPAVYAWEKAAASSSGVAESGDEAAFGWVVMELMPGLPLDVQFEKLGLDEKKKVVEQIAAIFSAVQAVELPPGVHGHGGLTIDETGDIVTGQSTLLKGGPWREYDAYWVAKLLAQLQEADESEVLKGWRSNGVRERIDKFIQTKLGAIIRDSGIETSKLALIHVDFTMNNMLYDPETKHITSLLDFDWASITHPGHEFFMSFADIGGCLNNRKTDGITSAVLAGHFDGEGEDWEIAKTWDEALRKRNAIRPSDIRGIETMEKLHRFDGLLCPFELANAVAVKRRTEEQVKDLREKKEQDIIGVLSGWGL